MFCGNCGTKLHEESGLCPMCEAEALKAFLETPKFCMTCGGEMDRLQGVCPHCEQQKEVQLPEAADPLPEPPVEKLPKKASNGRAGYIGKTIALCAVLVTLFAVVLVTSVVGMVQSSFTVERATEMIEKVDWSDAIDMLASKKVNDFYGYVEENVGIAIDEDHIVDFMETTSVKRFMAEKLTKVAVGFGKGRDVVISYDEIEDLLMDNRKFFEKELHHVLTEEDAVAITNYIVHGGEPTLHIQDIRDESPMLFLMLGCSTSKEMLILMLLLTLVLTALAFVILPIKGLLGVGIVGCVSGLLMLSLNIVVKMPFVTSMFPGVVADLAAMAVGWFLLPSLIMLAVGALLIVAYVIVTKIQKKNA